MSAREASRPLAAARPAVPARSAASVSSDPSTSSAPSGLRGDLRFLRSEVSLVLHRRRNLVMLGVLSLLTILVGVGIWWAGRGRGDAGAGDAPPLFSSITDNGLFLAFAALTASLPIFLPLVVSVVAGESVAGEAQSGTLRYLLVTPVDRTRLLAVKYVATLVYGLLGALTIAVTGILVGLVLFPFGDVVLLSGTSTSYADGLARLAGVTLYAALMLATVAALGLLVSTLTEVPVAAMSATAIAVVLVQIMGQVPQLDWLHPFLFTDGWLRFADLLRDPVSWSGMGQGVLLQGAWIAVLLAAAWARMTGKDVTS